MIHLDEIRISGFHIEDKSISVIFPKSDVAIIYGSNGSGKTTFLKILNAIFNRNSKILKEYSVENITIKFTNKNQEKKEIKIKKRSDNEKLSFIKENVTKENLMFSFEEDLILSLFDNIEDTKIKSKNINNILSLNTSIDDYDWSEYECSGLEDTKSLSLGIDRGVSYSSSNLTISEDDIRNFLINNREFKNIFNRISLSSFSEELSVFLTRRSKQRSRVRSNSVVDLDNNHIYLPKIDLNDIESLLLHKYRKARSDTTKRIQNALFETLSTIIEDKSNNYEDSLSENFDSLMDKYKNRIIEALTDISDNALKKKIIQRLKTNNKNKDKSPILDFLINNMIKELENEKQLLSSINSVIDGFNKHLSNNKKLVITLEEIYIDIKGVKYPINILSSGEKHIFTFLASVNVVGSSRDFLIIDEPEISLNVSWQRSILSILKEIAPQTQIIVASHSPLISKNMNESLVPIKHLNNN